MTRVLVAHETEAIREVTERVVRDAGYEVVGVVDGEQARPLLFGPSPPAALVVDVGLSGVPAYELVAELRAKSLPTRVVLVASVYSKTAYKRRPSSLYGADDYIEQHHIPDELVEKLARLIPGGQAPARDLASEREALVSIRDAGEERLAFHPTSPSEDVVHARRLARLILADALLYNGKAVEEGLAAGNLAERIRADLQAVREMFALRVPAHVATAEDYVGVALEEFVCSRSKQPI